MAKIIFNYAQPALALAHARDHGGLKIGGIEFPNLPCTVIAHRERPLLQFFPAANGMPLRFRVQLVDHLAPLDLHLDGSTWAGNRGGHLITMDRARLSVWSPCDSSSLRLRLDPGGGIVAEHLDMRCGDGHILATEHTYIAGRLMDGTGTCRWVHASVTVRDASAETIAFHYSDVGDLLACTKAPSAAGQRQKTADGLFVFDKKQGFMYMPAGIVIAANSGGMRVTGAVASGLRTITDARNVFLRAPDTLPEFIGNERRD
jgi:hypothetical protein